MQTEFSGWTEQERTLNASLHAAWKQKYAHSTKTEILEQLANACGLGSLLVQHWLRADRLNPAALEFFETCKHCYQHEIGGYFLSGTVLDDWYLNDWRGKKQQAPTAAQLFERALMMKSKLEREGQLQAHAMPIAKRVSAIDGLPALYNTATEETII